VDSTGIVWLKDRGSVSCAAPNARRRTTAARTDCQVANWKGHKSIFVALREHTNGTEISGHFASWKIIENQGFVFIYDDTQYAGESEKGLPHG
jgi:hypothetical protein